MKIFPLLSGGVDSTIAILARMANRDFDEIHPMFINYGQKACKQEWNSVCRVSRKLAKLIEGDTVSFHNPIRIDLSCTSIDYVRIFQWSKSQLITGKLDANPYVENRNMILISVASSFVESRINEHERGTIITGFRDEWPDTQREFVTLMNRLLKFLLSDKRKIITVEAPIINFGPQGKAKMVAAFQRYKEILDLTWSCYNPTGGKPCQKCKACRDRKQAFPHRVLWRNKDDKK